MSLSNDCKNIQKTGINYPPLLAAKGDNGLNAGLSRHSRIFNRREEAPMESAVIHLLGNGVMRFSASNKNIKE